MPPVVAYLGPEKTNTHLAALKRFGPRCRYVHAPTVEDVFQAVEREQADYGVIPIENSLEGAVTHTLDRFIDFKRSPARICGEIEMPIRHCLLTLPRTRRQEVRVVFSHPQALAQCRRWLDRNYPHVARRETRSTAEAAEELVRRDSSLWPRGQRAAIGSRELAREHRLRGSPIPVGRDNRTRFLVISLRGPAAGRRSKTSVMFALKDKPGALHDALMPFKRNRINLTKIESRPSKQKAWEYLFFVDLEGAESEPRVRRALEALRRSTAGMRVLGSYPAGS
ncbi:MAG: prephenate dehydratase [Candidatus Omnitrophica bacterium]|nr:prephenate dehydratase [Candidatus Omnitrophota bacterium]